MNFLVFAGILQKFRYLQGYMGTSYVGLIAHGYGGFRYLQGYMGTRKKLVHYAGME